MKEKLNKYDLFVVGNGFDIACGYKTEYADYLKSGKSNKSRLYTCFNNSYDLEVIESENWNSFEKMLCQYLCFIKYLFTSTDVKREFTEEYYGGYKSYTFYIHDNIKKYIDIFMSFRSLAVTLNEILTLKLYTGELFSDYYILRDYLENESIISLKFVYYDSFSKLEAKDEIVEKRIIKKIEEELSKLEIGLQNYIKEETSKESRISNFLQNLISKYDFNYLLSFNYSHIAEKVLNIDKNKSFYIHGDIDSSIILGVEDNMLSNQTINNESNYAVFFKRYRRILKNTITGLDNRILAFINDKSIIGIYGHSLDLSDKSIFTRIFNSKAARFDIYCYEDINIYKERVNRLIGLDLFEELCSSERINFIKIPKENS